MKKTIILLVAATLLWAVPQQVQARKTLNFCVYSDISDVLTAYYGFLQIAYDELGYDLTLKRLPLKRTHSVVNDGKMDGIVITTPQSAEKHPNLRKVTPHLATVNISAFTKEKNIEIKGPQSLVPYKLGVVRGYALTDKITTGMDRQLVNNYKSLFSILQVGRVDIVLCLRKEGLRFIEQNPRFNEIAPIDPPVLILPLYHFLNKKHEDLIPKLTPIMERLMEDKILEKLYEPFLI